MKMRWLVLALVVGGIFAGMKMRGPRVDPEAVLGLWTQFDSKAPADEMRFYYFHKGGKGLYRYGQVAYNQTHSFDWSVDGNELKLLFRKSGERAKTVIELGGSGNARTITLEKDPRGPGKVKYTRRPANLDEETLMIPALERLHDKPTASGPAGRMWIDLRRYATGGAGFRFYQLSDHGCPGRPGSQLGWYHLGDGDDWTTETLCYRFESGVFQLHFEARNEDAKSRFDHRKDARQDHMSLELARDPRNFLHQSLFIDAGPSF